MRLVFIFWLFCAAMPAQESDTTILNTAPRHYTVLDQTQDPQERRDFLALYKANEPERKRELADGFLKAHPQSWLLPQVYEAAAKASIDLGDYKRAVQDGRFSLRLLPENPLLEVPLANVEGKQGLLDAAIQDARDALDQLEMLAAPAGLRDWNDLKSKLEASAWFVLGRVYAVQGLAGKPRLVAASDALEKAATLNPKDLEIYYLRGIVESARGRSNLAARYFDLAAREDSPFRDLALAQLRRIRSFAQADASPEPSASQAAPPETLTSIRKGYAGSEVCKTCHEAEYAAWKRTGMGRMLRAYAPQNVIGNFAAGTEFRDENRRLLVRMGNRPRPYFEFPSSDGGWRRFFVDYTIGSKWQQGYATKLSDGRLQVLPIEYNSAHKIWVNYWKMIDPPDSERANVADFPKLLSATNYQQNCAICHTSQTRAASAGPDGAALASFLEPGVDCEMCHGPSAWHVEQMKSGHREPKATLDGPVDFAKIGNREAVRICAQCHRQSAVREMGPRGEMNYSTEGASFAGAFQVRPYNEFSRRAFYKDGRFRETTFIAESFTRSACFRKGTAQCASCHNPHLADAAENPTSLKFRGNPDEMCLQCHSEYRGKIAEHTHHAVSSEGSRCVSCHMPRIMNSLTFVARSHQIDDIPVADLTERFGQRDSPNACLLCHEDRDTHWVAGELAKW